MNWYKASTFTHVDKQASILSGLEKIIKGLVQGTWGIFKTAVYFLIDLPLSNAAMGSTSIDVKKAFMDIMYGAINEIKGLYEIGAATAQGIATIAQKTAGALKELFVGYAPKNIDKRSERQIYDKANEMENKAQNFIIEQFT
ncbi:MAG: hypothetical protein GF329_15815 [Candidatus Lokiarchaeota archaeon]|nr:hypothetical protein [Candidatus Lokiarchaeota archaeon]